jgi:hypothetical protein
MGRARGRLRLAFGPRTGQGRWGQSGPEGGNRQLQYTVALVFKFHPRFKWLNRNDFVRRIFFSTALLPCGDFGSKGLLSAFGAKPACRASRVCLCQKQPFEQKLPRYHNSRAPHRARRQKGAPIDSLLIVGQRGHSRHMTATPERKRASVG